MEIVLNDQGYVSSYNLTTDTSSIGGDIVDNPVDLQDFEVNFYCYKLEGGKLIKDNEKVEEYRIINLKNQVRTRRQAECFNIVDRSKFWYDSLTEAQLNELKTWYDAWLDAPETLVIPTAPLWL